MISFRAPQGEGQSMRVAWIEWSAAALTAAFALLAGGPLNAADQSGVHYVAEELGNRTKPAEAAQGAPKGLSDSAVRVMSTFALSIVPDQVPAGPGGQMVKLDKSDPAKYLIPLDDARQIIPLALCGGLPASGVRKGQFRRDDSGREGARLDRRADDVHPRPAHLRHLLLRR